MSGAPQQGRDSQDKEPSSNKRGRDEDDDDDLEEGEIRESNANKVPRTDSEMSVSDARQQQSTGTARQQTYQGMPPPPRPPHHRQGRGTRSMSAHPLATVQNNVTVAQPTNVHPQQLNSLTGHMNNIAMAPQTQPTSTATAPGVPRFNSAPPPGFLQANTNTPLHGALQPATFLSGLRPANRRPWTVDDFRPGTVIYAPYHETNLDPHAYPIHGTETVQTATAIVSSKRRPMVVLWVYNDNKTLFALVSGTHGKRGISHLRKDDERQDFVCLKDYDDHDFVNQSPHQFLEVHRKPNITGVGKLSSVRITGGASLSLTEDITIKGWLTREDATYIQNLWLRTARIAIDENFARWDGVV